MQNKSSLATPMVLCSLWLFIAFILVLTLILACFSWYAIKTQENMANELNQQQEFFRLFEQSCRHFDAMQIATLQYRETKDSKFEEQFQSILAEAIGYSLEAAELVVRPETRKLIAELLDQHHQFEAFFRIDAQIGRELERMEAESPDMALLQEKQRAIRQEQEVVADKIKGFSADILAIQSDRLAVQKEDARMTTRRLNMAYVGITFVSFVCIIVAGLVFVFIIQIANRSVTPPVTPRHLDGFSHPIASSTLNPIPPDDQRVIADKLQEVVDLLRK